MTQAIVMYVFSLAELGLALYVAYSGRHSAKHNWSMVLATCCGAVWALGIGMLHASARRPAQYVGACLIEAGITLGFAALAYHLQCTLCSGHKFIRGIVRVQFACACVVLPVYLASGHIQIEGAGGALHYAMAPGPAYMLSTVYKLASIVVVAFILLFSIWRARFQRERFQAQIILLCCLVGGVLVWLNRTGSEFSYLPGGVAQFVTVLALYLISLRFPGVTSNAVLVDHLYARLRTPLFVVGLDNTIISANNSAMAICGGETLKAVVRHDIRDFFEFEDGYRPLSIYKKENICTGYSAVSHFAGAICEVEVTYVYDDFEELVCAIFIVNDITFQKQMMNQLDESRRKAEQANRAKTAFLANTSHEIRTPMNAIVGMSELLLREDLPQTAKEQALSIKQAGSNLLSIVNDILDYSKIESGKLELAEAEYSFATLLNDVIGIIRVRLIERPILFVVNVDSAVPARMVGDETRTRQIILNLLNNAVKYTRQGFVTLNVALESQSDKEAVLAVRVADSGVGIRQEDMDKIFIDFARVDSQANQGVEGTGLGLAITRQLCRAMGGEIEVASTYGEGSVFALRLPQKLRGYEPLAAVENPENRQVLVYETRQMFAASIVRSVRDLGVECELATSREAFFEALKEFEYPFAFVPSDLFDKARTVVERLHLHTQLVLLAEYGEVVSSRNVRTISMPVYCVPVANILNYETTLPEYNQNANAGIRFIAPTAKVLVVDDINTNLKVAEGLMAPFQMQVDLCRSGAQAILMVKEKAYDVVFMDHMMPEMDGIEAAKFIRGMGEEYRDLPIIALTANAMSGMREMFIKNGMDDYLAKPIDTSRLYTMLDRWIPKEKKEPYAPDGTPSAEAALEIEGVNTALGIEMCGGSRQAYMSTLQVFYLDGMQKLVELRAALEKGDLALYTTYAHGLKSAAHNVGAKGLSEFAKSMEFAGKQENRAYIVAQNDNFLAELDNLLQRIATVLPKRSGRPDATPGDLESLADELGMLREALAQMDAEDVEEIFGRLRTVAWPQPVEETLEAVSGHIMMFDYEEAAQQLDGLV